MFPRPARSKNLLLLKQHTRGGVGCSFLFPKTRSSPARNHLAILGPAADEIRNCKKQSAPSRNHLQQQQSFLSGLSHITQTQQSARSQSLCFPRGGLQHPCVTTSVYRPERPTNQLIRPYVQLQQQRRQSTSLAPSNFFNFVRINQNLTDCTNASQVLELLADLSFALRKPAGGGVLDAANFSTAMNRLARHSAVFQKTRHAVLQDPHVALLVAAVAEVLDDMNNNSNNNDNDNSIVFDPVHLSNIAWALAKLQLPPPTQKNNDTSSSTSLTERASDVRQTVQQAMKQRQQQPQQDSGESTRTTPWMKALTQLAGHMLDDIGNKVVAKTIAFSKDNDEKPAWQQLHTQSCANLLWAWAKADRADPVVMESVIQHMIHQQKKELSTVTTQKAADLLLKPYQWSISLWAIATARMYHGHQDLLEFVAHVLVKNQGFLDQFSAQEISNLVWATATLLVNKPEPLTDREQTAALTIVRSAANYVLRKGKSGSFDEQNLSNTLWSMATLGFGLSSSAEPSLNNDYVVLESDNLSRDAEMMKKVFNKTVKASLPLLPHFKIQGLSCLAWSLARFVDFKIDAVDSLLDGIVRQVQRPNIWLTSQDVSSILWSFTTLKHIDEDLYRSLASRLTSRQAHTYKPQHMSRLVFSLATAKISLRDRDAFDTSFIPVSQRPLVRDPATVIFHLAARQLMRRPHEFNSQDISSILWSFSAVGIRHPTLFQSVAKHLVGDDESDNGGDVASPARGLNEFSARQLNNMAYAFALQAQLGKDVSERMKGATSLALIVSAHTTARLDIGEGLLQRFFSAIAQSSTTLVPKADPPAMANTAWAFEVLGLKDLLGT